MSVKTGLHETNLAARRAEEAEARRFQAVEWLQSVLGQLDIPSQPSEKEFISCLRNGMILCNAINKIQPGAVFKVVENYSYLNGEPQHPLAYQYFENVRNFLVAVEELKLPGFEASDLEKDIVESASVTKVVDCILGLKAYHECKITTNGNRSYKQVTRPPTFQLSATKMHPLSASKTFKHDESDISNEIARLIIDHMRDSKENIDEELLSFRNGSGNAAVNFLKIMSRFPELQSRLLNHLDEGTRKQSDLESTSLEELPVNDENQSNRSFLRKTKGNYKGLLKQHEKELAVVKTLFTQTKQDFKVFQAQTLKDIMEVGNQILGMFSAAQGYHKVVEENRKLYNMVQDLKGNIRVYCRVRPTFNSEMKGVIDYVGKDGSLIVVDPSKPNKDARKTFQFNQTFGPTATQGDVFRETQPLIRSVMDGYNVCIFAYGQTGSGKTYTMSGPPGRSATEMGINYLALNDLFLICDQRKDMTYKISVQMVEIYNEQVRDLLAENSSSTKLDIRTCSSEVDGLSLPDATMHSVNSTKDVLQLMEAGEVNRAVGSTSMNNRSSRSHSIFMVHVRGKDTSGGTLRSCLHLVDLAGSERVDKSEVIGDRLKEAQHINKSLSCLGDVISALAQKNSHIPYRNSKLTLLLQDSLGGQAKTLMFAHLSPEEDSFGETISTLKFAQRVSTVELGAARVQKDTREVMQLKDQIENLKKELGAEESNNGSNSGSKEIKSPYSRPITTTEKTPPRIKRLSIENCSNTKAANLEDRKGDSHVASRPPKIPSLEGQKSCKNRENSKGDLPMEMHQLKSPPSCESSYQNRAVKVEGSTSIPQLQLLQTPAQGDLTMKVHQLKNPPTPESSYQNRAVKVDGSTSIPRLQLSQTPVQGASRNEVHQLESPPRPVSSYQNRALKVDGSTSIPQLQLLQTPVQGASRNEVHQVENPPSPVSSYQNRTLKVEGSTTIPQLQLSQTPVQGASRNEVHESPPSPVSSYQNRALKVEGSTSIPRLQLSETPVNGDSRNDQLKNPLIPVSSYQNRALKVEGSTRIPSLRELFQTPVEGAPRNELQITSVDSRTNGKGSQMLKSLMTFGKLLTGSEKRKGKKSVDPSPPGATSNFNHINSPGLSNGQTMRRQSLAYVLPSPGTSNARTMRRQSLTGVMPPGQHHSRRFSLGGNTIENGVSGSRNAKTIPPIPSASKKGKKLA